MERFKIVMKAILGVILGISQGKIKKNLRYPPKKIMFVTKSFILLGTQFYKITSVYILVIKRQIAEIIQTYSNLYNSNF